MAIGFTYRLICMCSDSFNKWRNVDFQTVPKWEAPKHSKQKRKTSHFLEVPLEINETLKSDIFILKMIGSK